MSKAEDVIAGLGGADNIEDVEGCITRLRCEVKDSSKVDAAALKKLAHGVMVSGSAVQVVVGPTADALAEEVQDLL